MSRFWKLQSSFRLNAFIGCIVLMLGLLGFFAYTSFIESPLAHLAELSDESKIMRRAHEGNADAALQVGISSLSNGGQKNYKEAAKWLEQAAKLDNIEAQYYYGLSLLSGRGIIQDYKAGFYWIEKAAKKGYAEAQYNLGKMYRRGTGVEIDRARSYLWFNLAAAQGYQDAARNRDSVASHLALNDVIAMQEEAYRISMSETAKLSENDVVYKSDQTSLQQ